MDWVRYVLMDQALDGGGMCSTECPSSFRIKLAVLVGFLCWVVHFTAKTQPRVPRSFQKTSGIKLWKGRDQRMGLKKYFKGLEYPLEHSQDNHEEVDGIWYNQDPAEIRPSIHEVKHGSHMSTAY